MAAERRAIAPIMALFCLLVLVGVTALAEAATFSSDQQRISAQGPDGNENFSGFDSAIAYNPTANEYLVVWRGQDDAGALHEDELEIYGRIVAPGGAPKGATFRISDIGPEGDPDYDVFEPQVAYNSVSDQYLVVWRADDNTPPLVDNELEIFGQLLDATGAEIGANDFRISSMGTNGDPNLDAFDPSVVHNPTANEYLVVWDGDEDTVLVDNEFEIYGQRLDAAGGLVGGALRVSDMGPDNSADFDAREAEVAYNPTADEYLVVWRGDDDTGALLDQEFEIYGQRLDPSGTEIGLNDFRISDMGPDGNTEYRAETPAIVHNRTANEYLVTWDGDDDIAPLVDNEFEIFGQRLDPSGTGIGANDFRISNAGPDGNGTFDAFESAVAHNPTADEYLVVWEGDDHSTEQTNDEEEVSGQRLTGAGIETGDDDFRISRMGPDLDPDYEVEAPAIAYNSVADEFLTAWDGNDDTAPLVIDEFEVYTRGVAGVEPEPEPDPEPEPEDTAVTLQIAGKKLKLNRKRATRVKITCAADEASPPCRGKLRLKTRKKVKSGAKKRKIVLAKKKFSLDAGQTKKLKLKLKKKHARLVRRKKAARKVKAIANVRDAAANTARITKTMKLKPKKRKKKR